MVASLSVPQQGLGRHHFFAFLLQRDGGFTLDCYHLSMSCLRIVALASFLNVLTCSWLSCLNIIPPLCETWSLSSPHVRFLWLVATCHYLKYFTSLVLRVSLHPLTTCCALLTLCRMDIARDDWKDEPVHKGANHDVTGEKAP